MFKHMSTKHYNWILIIGVILFVFEIVFYGAGTLVSIAFSALFLYFGWKNFHLLWGKIVFWAFFISIFFLVFHLVAVRFFILAAVIILLINYTKSTKEPTYIKPTLSGREKSVETLIRLKPLFDQKIFDDHYTEETVYQWRDVNIHGLSGDRVIDLSNTVLPVDTSVISIRHGLGNIEIYIPYEVEVSIHHSAIFGKADIFDDIHEKLFNKSLYYQTEGYDEAVSRVKIITAVISGDIEVKRI